MANNDPLVFEFDLDDLEKLNKGLQIDDIFYVNELKQRKLFLNGDIDQFSVEDIIKNILQFNRDDRGVSPSEREPIRLYVNSNGGDVDAGFALIDVIQMSETPVYTINLGFQYSMAFLIGLAGHKRFAAPNAKFLMHDGSNFVYNSATKVQDQIKFQNRVEERIKKYVISRSKITEKEYDDNLRVEWYLFADEAKEKGFVDCIIGEDAVIGDII